MYLYMDLFESEIKLYYYYYIIIIIKTNHQRHVFVNLNSKRIAQTNLNILSSFLWRYLLTIFKPALCKKKSLSSMHVKWNKLF